VAILALLAAGMAGAGEREAKLWWQPRFQADPQSAPTESSDQVARTLPTALRMLRLFDHPGRVRPYLIALREFGLLNETPGSGAPPVRVALAPALAAVGFPEPGVTPVPGRSQDSDLSREDQ
jgi:hypothetical protein